MEALKAKLIYLKVKVAIFVSLWHFLAIKVSHHFLSFKKKKKKKVKLLNFHIDFSFEFKLSQAGHVLLIKAARSAVQALL